MTDKSILILPVKPYACGECPLQGVGICEAGKCAKGHIEDSDECLESCEDAYDEGE